MSRKAPTWFRRAKCIVRGCGFETKDMVEAQRHAKETGHELECFNVQGKGGSYIEYGTN